MFKLIESAQSRWRAVNAPHLVALVRALQEVHYDVVLPGPKHERLAVEGALLDDIQLLAAVEAWVNPHIDTFQSLFEPRQRR